MLKGFFDDTGTHQGSRVTGIGGFVGAADAWTALEPKWASVLDEFADKGVRWLHASEAIAQKGQFARITKPELNYILTTVSQELGRHPLTGFFSAVITDDWGAIQDADFLKRFPRPIDLCFQNLVEHLWRWGKANVDGEPIVPVFAYSDEQSSHMKSVLDAYGSHEWYREVLGPIAFDFPQRVIPLQAADLLVHQMNWDTEKRFFEQPTLATAGMTRALSWATGDGRFVHGNYLDEDGLLLTVHRFQVAGSPAAGPVSLF
jgi:hypothetical protein